LAGPDFEHFIKFLTSGWAPWDAALFTAIFLAAPIVLLLALLIRYRRELPFFAERILSRTLAPCMVAIAVPPATWGIKILSGVREPFAPRHVLAGLTALWPAGLIGAWAIYAAARRVRARTAAYFGMLLAFGAWHLYCFKTLELDQGALFGAIPIDAAAIIAAGLAGVPIAVLGGLAGARLQRLLGRAGALEDWERGKSTGEGIGSHKTGKSAVKPMSVLLALGLAASLAAACVRLNSRFTTWFARSAAADEYRVKIGSRSAWPASLQARYRKVLALLADRAPIEEPFLSDVLWNGALYDPPTGEVFSLFMVVAWIADDPEIEAIRIETVNDAGEALSVCERPMLEQKRRERPNALDAVAVEVRFDDEGATLESTAQLIRFPLPLVEGASRLKFTLTTADDGRSNALEFDLAPINLLIQAKAGSREAVEELAAMASESFDPWTHRRVGQLLAGLEIAEIDLGDTRILRPATLVFWLKDNEGNVFWDDEKRMWRLGDTEGGRGDGRHSEDSAEDASQ